MDCSRFKKQSTLAEDWLCMTWKADMGVFSHRLLRRYRDIVLSTTQNTETVHFTTFARLCASVKKDLRSKVGIITFNMTGMAGDYNGF